jgi:hypothetical protein|tara:strand:+ start:95 stop:262 length:168 start_codon:yes stop_codon:yes gene_type:complete
MCRLDKFHFIKEELLSQNFNIKLQRIAKENDVAQYMAILCFGVRKVELAQRMERK